MRDISPAPVVGDLLFLHQKGGSWPTFDHLGLGFVLVHGEVGDLLQSDDGSRGSVFHCYPEVFHGLGRQR